MQRNCSKTVSLARIIKSGRPYQTVLGRDGGNQFLCDMEVGYLTHPEISLVISASTLVRGKLKESNLCWSIIALVDQKNMTVRLQCLNLSIIRGSGYNYRQTLLASSR